MKDIDFGADREYYVQASWGVRPEAASALADRFVRQIDTLTAIDPLFDLWTCGVKRPTKFEKVRDHYVDEVRASIARDDWCVPEPIYGYYLGAITRGRAGPLSYALRAHAGNTVTLGPQLRNDVLLETAVGYVPDPAAISYRIFKSALLSFVELWDPVQGIAYPTALRPFHKNPNDLFRDVWMQYLSAPLARRITPPPTAIVEPLANGGVLMSATTETFRVDNPTHLSAARDIAAATAPLNDISLSALD